MLGLKALMSRLSCIKLKTVASRQGVLSTEIQLTGLYKQICAMWYNASFKCSEISDQMTKEVTEVT